MTSETNDEYVVSITPYVMKYLAKSRFFEGLDDLMCPSEESCEARKCGGNYGLAESLLLESGLDRADFDDVFAVLRAQGGFCDCEILYNVVESSRLKAEYWRGRADLSGDQVKRG
jgi:Protein of unknown function (DUF2695)